MRKHLNNPKVVIPLAVVALFWGGYRYGFFDFLASKLFSRPEVRSSSLGLSSPPQQTNEHSKIRMQRLMRDGWLTSNWIRESIIRNEPFVAEFDFNKDPISEIAEIERPEEKVIVDQETFEATIASDIGLDRDGFFVVFNNVLNLPVRKRVGDEIYLEDGRVLYIPTFGIAESSRTPEEQKAKVEEVLSKMRLVGVSTESSEADGNGSMPPGNSPGNSVLIQVAGQAIIFYRQGDIIHHNPSLGLDQVYEGEDYDWIILVDAAQNQYKLSAAGQE